MRFVPLGSGSQGNATLVEFGSTRLLIDAGLSARALRQRLELLGVDPRSIEGILISHEHSDHVRGAERFSRLHGVPVFCALETLEAMDRSPVDFAAWAPLPAGETTSLGCVDVDSFPVPHDAASPVGFVLRGEGLRVGVATDLGHVTTLVRERLRGCQLLMIESNHDDGMLREGPYPWHIKQRVAGRMGHLSNSDAAAVLREIVDDTCRAVVLAHLSKTNNRPDLARQAAVTALSSLRHNRIAMRVASARRPTPPIEM